jgi:hypothetical protein
LYAIVGYIGLTKIKYYCSFETGVFANREISIDSSSTSNLGKKSIFSGGYKYTL